MYLSTKIDDNNQAFYRNSHFYSHHLANFKQTIPKKDDIQTSFEKCHCFAHTVAPFFLGCEMFSHSVKTV